MASKTMVALAFAAFIFCGISAQVAMAADTGRTLSAALGYNCGGAKTINTVPNACNLLCGCVGSLNSAFAGSGMRGFCVRSCEGCSAAAQKCKKKGMPLPSQCQMANSIKEVGTCISTFLAATGRGH